ncbi:class I SAM-dependent methyltransferase [Nocardioides daphniae]|uniref:Methyltransferase domain-containing protein n=1 Tax=Nocardioides daphniae TaxID=402297 RepID=A0A4V1CWA3_9ACTN|nr:methyltransferase domain-containing protein [Nocardioides daphniae]QCC76567.1 methyltransferase domain-containing protein [Nocardioides daphniae]GGD05262.1 hypothetical protein GCM10007231_00060 [Nocardioides daphniae]
MDDRQKLENYFAEVDASQVRLKSTKPSDSKLRVAAKRLVPMSRRSAARMAVTNAVRPFERRKAERIEATTHPLRLHLGSGGEHKDGWINIDCVGDPVELAWNLVHGIPFSDGSAQAIFHEHLFEHIPLQAGLGLMDECFRVLEPGGILRVGVPDAGALIRSYVGDGEYVDALHPGRPTRLLGVQELFYWHAHVTMYDDETLATVFRAGGFPDPVKRKYQDTDLEKAPDTPTRASQTLYMEARKPLS